MNLPSIPKSFFNGDCFDAYRILGAHPWQGDHGEEGWRFAVWAPGATAVEVCGGFDGWGAGIPLQKADTGVWSGFVSGLCEGELYKYRIHGADGSVVMRADPYAFASEVRPANASRLTRLDFSFDDSAWMERRDKCRNLPMNIYELHAGSWKHKPNSTQPDGSDGWYDYEELARELIPWLLEHHFTHVELLPLAEHPFDGSWGYQTTGYFAVTSRYGTPAQFASFVNACHRMGIGVIMDFVPVHFAANADALANFDGTHLYEYDSDVGHSEWGTCNFNYYRREVCSFLNSAAALWMEVYHCDGIRMDAISRALYWQGDPARGVNEGAVTFLRNLNHGLNERWPTGVYMAEDSTNFLKVTAPTRYDGIGFDYRREVCSFLNSAAALWMEVYHCDGIRMDAISRALYWQGDPARGVNEGAVTFLRNLNHGLNERWPTGVYMAEDSTNFLKVTAPTRYDGIGFDYKWDMGWMHDTLDYFATPFGQRPDAYGKIIFSMHYFYNELYLLALSHDEVVHGKKTVIDKLWGTYEEKCAQLRTLYFYMYAHPGKKLNFMGNELGHFREWDEKRELDWDLLKYPFHDAFQKYFGALSRLYATQPALYAGEYDPRCFEWVASESRDEGVYAWLRKGAGQTILCVMNTQNTAHKKFPLYLSFPAGAEELLNTEAPCWGGADKSKPKALHTSDGGVYGRDYTLTVDLPAMGSRMFKLTPEAPRPEAAQASARRAAAARRKAARTQNAKADAAAYNSKK